MSEATHDVEDDRPAAQTMALFVDKTTYARLPGDVAASVRARVLDTLGICLAASPLPTSAAARRWATAQGTTGEAHAVGIARPLSASMAAFVNGTLAHSLDYDDTHLPSVLHPSSSVIPTALAVGEATHATGRDVVAAAAAGLEVCVRLGMAGYDSVTKNSTFFERGQHATSICGAVASAATAAKLFRLGADGILNSIAIAASMASGIIEANRTGGTVKRMHCGWAAHAGISAAGLAKAGFTGPATVLEGRFGFYQAWLSGVFDAEALTSRLGERWNVPDIFFKPYPANHFTHTAVDAAAQLRAGGLRPEDVEYATLGVSAPTVHTVGEPITVKQMPETGYMAQFSGPYAVAVGLFGGSGLGAGLADYTDERARDRRRRELMKKVKVAADPICDRIFPFQFPAVLSVHTYDGRDLRAEVLTNLGSPQRPLTFDQLGTKFVENAAHVVSTEQASRIRAMIAALNEQAQINDVMLPFADSAIADTTAESR